MTDAFSQRKGDREGHSTEYREKDNHKIRQPMSLTVLGMKYHNT